MICGHSEGASPHPRLEVLLSFATPKGRKEFRVKDAVADSGAQITIIPASILSNGGISVIESCPSVAVDRAYPDAIDIEHSTATATLVTHRSVTYLPFFSRGLSSSLHVTDRDRFCRVARPRSLFDGCSSWTCGGPRLLFKSARRTLPALTSAPHDSTHCCPPFLTNTSSSRYAHSVCVVNNRPTHGS